MPARRILSVWFPRLGAERLLRRIGEGHDLPFAVVDQTGQTQILSSLSAKAAAAGLRADQPLRDAHAMCAGLVTRTRNAQAEAAFLQALVRWAGHFSPWVAAQGEDGLTLDITGCAHLFGGEAALVERLAQEAGAFGLTACCGLADTVGAAWALARYAGRAPGHERSGDAIDQEARATRSRAAKRRHWERGGTAPVAQGGGIAPRIAPPGQTHGALADLPVAALRLDPETVAQLGRLGLRRVGDLTGQPRAPLARRFGRGLVMRLDQALGAMPEPVSPQREAPHFATRLTLPEPIGMTEDILAALDRLLPRLCDRLRDRGQGARRIRLQAWRVDDTVQSIELGLARAAQAPERIRPLLAMKLEEIDAGFGIDILRLEAVQTEPVHARTVTGHVGATEAARARMAGDTGLEDLMGRIGGRIGLEAITRRHPASSHIPEKTAQVLAAAWSEPATGWPAPPVPRPLMMCRPEPVMAPDRPTPPDRFRWRGRAHDLIGATGPERIAPEWWLDEPDWRSGVRDYWQVTTARGDRLWLFYAHGAGLSSGWFCQGRFA
ncbi:protein ImuB [Roseovarius litoreus]|uniref:DNA-directed DNA polymerase n=1 Tax=Roseovarius litoreus TaxID=1155722 RepID=A0A1M7AD46_9RHOB|nr:DNA polymerase Y family protein [Roseovarius litoreus]SHL40588.1 protein ImuB [Roseovarius litoreus]